MPAYLFDVTCFASIRVNAESEDDARAMLREATDCTNANFGAWPDGTPIMGDVTIDDSYPDIIEVATSPLPRPRRRAWLPLRWHIARLRAEALARRRKARRKEARA